MINYQCHAVHSPHVVPMYPCIYSRARMDKHSLSERDVCTKSVIPALQRAG